MPILVSNRQRRVRLRLAWLRDFAGAALPLCFAPQPTAPRQVSPHEEVEVAIVSDRVIARVHLDFMGLPDPTDVITFEHGELVISADTAERCAGMYGHAVEVELALYIVHGLLHLNGFDDATPPEAARMRKVQNRIWRKCRAQLPPL